jgi:hypothetical protein
VVAVITWKKLALVSLKIGIVCLTGCTNQPTNQQLEVWRKEASDRNAEIVAKNAKNDQQPDWNLVIQGQTATGKTETLSWLQLAELSTANINTIDANNIVNPNKVFTFTGISVKSLIEQFNIPPEVTEITFVCYDAFQSTVKKADLIKYPIILATAKDGKPIPRSQGGPTYLVFPYSQYPEIKNKYDDLKWAFYVTHIIFGTEPATITVADTQINLKDLDQLPQVTLKQKVGYRFGWPSNEVELHGVRIKDVLSLAGVQLQPQQNIFVSGKPPVYQNQSPEQTLSSEIIQDCDVILATRWNKNKQPISAKMGGPVTLAFGDNCPAETKKLKWVTFVEGLKVQP